MNSFSSGGSMPKFASLFASHDEAEEAVRALRESKLGKFIETRVVNEEEWAKNWTDLDEDGLDGPPSSKHIDPDFNVWLLEESVHYYSEGLKKGGVVVVVDVPSDLTKEAEKIVKDHHGKIA
jgi:hypothetical protein